MRLSSYVALSALCLVCLSASRCASPLSGLDGRNSISIVAYNVKSLFDAVDDGTEFSEFSVAGGKWNEALYRLRLENLAAAVLAARAGAPPGPDVLCLEEIENAKVLEALRAGPLAAARYRYAAVAPAEGGPFSVCALSRLPILAARSHGSTGSADRTGRDILELELDAGEGRRLFLFGCHWKSKSEGAEITEEARREAAALLRGLIEARLSADGGARVVACGDFNESPDEYLRVGGAYATALMPVEAADSWKVSPTGPMASRLLVASRADALSRADRELVLFSPWSESEGYSYSYRGKRERIDGFLLSQGLLGGSGLRYQSFAPVDAAFLLDEAGDPIAWPASGRGGYSDHLPVLLELELGS